MDAPGNNCHLVMVEWEDSVQPSPNWLHLSNFEKAPPLKCASVGWMIQSDRHTTALAPNMGAIDNEQQIQASGVIRIPTRAITKISLMQERMRQLTSIPLFRLGQARRRKRS